MKTLLVNAEHNTENIGCVACVQCERCVGSTFCSDSKGLVRCHYCTSSARLTDCTHCRSSSDLLACNHCIASERCARSSYVVKSFDCEGCTYCFGCVGLSKKDFHILNRPYDKATYFALTAQLMRELGLGGDGAAKRHGAPSVPTGPKERGNGPNAAGPASSMSTARRG